MVRGPAVITDSADAERAPTHANNRAATMGVRAAGDPLIVITTVKSTRNRRTSAFDGVVTWELRRTRPDRNHADVLTRRHPMPTHPVASATNAQFGSGTLVEVPVEGLPKAT